MGWLFSSSRLARSSSGPVSIRTCDAGASGTAHEWEARLVFVMSFSKFLGEVKSFVPSSSRSSGNCDSGVYLRERSSAPALISSSCGLAFGDSFRHQKASNDGTKRLVW